MAPSSISLNVPYIKTLHKTPYPAISPLRPELTQAGRTVLITGGSSGIGFAIARAFVQASALHVILTGRRENVLAEAVSRLKAENPSAGTLVTGLVSDMSDPQDTEKLWSGLKSQGIVVDVLVLNAMKLGELKPILQAGLESTWSAFETNVRGLLDYAIRFHEQGKDKPKASSLTSVSANPRLTIHVSVSHQHLIHRRAQLHHRECSESHLRPHQELRDALDAADRKGHKPHRHADHQLSSRSDPDPRGRGRRL
jgi:NAD(P)-dependent dehydrogenase (short-subunit alcohol dehydrogenase family)